MRSPPRGRHRADRGKGEMNRPTGPQQPFLAAIVFVVRDLVPPSRP